jgi:hypothetical protein
MRPLALVSAAREAGMSDQQPAIDVPSDEDASIEQDLDFQNRQWRIQRWGWAVMTAIVIAALLGLTGAGPLATASQRTADAALQIEYSRIERVQAPSELAMEVTTSGADQVAIWLANDFLDTITIESMSPEPSTTEAGAERQVFIFAADPEATTAQVRIGFQHESAGMVSGIVGIVGGPEISFSQFVLP